MTNRLYVGNLAFDATEDGIRQHFATCGDVVGVSVMMDRETGRSRGFAFVEMASADAAQNSLDVTTALARAQRILRTWFGVDQGAIGPIATILAETASNVTHSDDRGFAVIQHHRRQTGEGHSSCSARMVS